MENTPTLFRFEGKPLNVQTDENGDLWFHAGDVCRVLELSNVTMALRVLDEDEKGLKSIETLGGKQEVNCVTEPGIYKLVSRSRKPEAKRFDRWVRHEVLPTIRKTGTYSTTPAIDLNDPAFLRSTLLTYTEKVIALEAEKAEAAPKLEVFERLANSKGRTNLREVGKELQIGSKRGIEFLREIKWTFRDQAGRWKAYSGAVDAGYIEMKYTTYTNSAGEEVSTQQVFITPKGMTRLAHRLGMQ
ncbi:phage antirepressor [Novacetimonas hansenii]|uniref:phage antirepressor n=1 Tax=Novacetimonas hansenii TaxID=436 RepID=UPI00094F6B07|nr:phage antirepressor KilAC domain-containing protein [Novacetimonas hansenii]